MHIVYNFGLSECNRVKDKSSARSGLLLWSLKCFVVHAMEESLFFFCFFFCWFLVRGNQLWSCWDGQLTWLTTLFLGRLSGVLWWFRCGVWLFCYSC